MKNRTNVRWLTQLALLAAILLVGTAVIAHVHRMNYVRIIRGTEIGFRSAARGDHRKA